MPAKKIVATYKIVLRNKRGGFSLPRYAVTFEVFYGKRKILVRTEIPKRYRLVAQKKKFFEKIVKEIEKKRVAALKKQRMNREKKKQQKIKEDQAELRRLKRLERAFEAQKAEDVRKVLKKVKKGKKGKLTLEMMQAIVAPQFSSLREESLDFSKQREEEPLTLPNATVEDVLITPYTPKSKLYEKEIVAKKITTPSGILQLRILNFDLKPDSFVELNRNTAQTKFETAYYTFAPHIFKFFEEVKETDKRFIFRIKIASEIRPGLVTEQGVSEGRFEAHTLEDLREFVFSTFNRLLKNKNNARENYLAGVQALYITGFTLEGAHFI